MHSEIKQLNKLLIITIMKTTIIARNTDNKVYQFEYRKDMLATQLPHRHVSGYPFDGNFYAEGSDYQPKKGVEIEDKYGFLTHENSPYLVIEDENRISYISLSKYILINREIKYILGLKDVLDIFDEMHCY